MKIRYLLLGLSVVLNLNYELRAFNKNIPTAEEIAEIMKTDEFNDLVNEISKIIESTPDEKEVKKTKPKNVNIKQDVNIKSKKRKLSSSELETAFMEETKKDERTSLYNISDAQVEAFDYYVNKFLKRIKILQSSIENLDFGISFQDYLNEKNFFGLLENLYVKLKLIKSKKFYKKIFFSKKYTLLRRKIIEFLKKSKIIIDTIQKYQKDKEKNNLNLDDLTVSNITSYIDINDIKYLYNEYLFSINTLVIKLVADKMTERQINKKIKEREKREKEAKKRVEGFNRSRESFNRRFFWS